MSRSLLPVLLTGLSFCFCGCSGSDLPELATVTGTVTLDGGPLADAVVTFTPAEARPSMGQTDSSGNYQLNYLEDVGGGGHR